MNVQDQEALLADLNAAQREAVTAVTGPVCILAGAGTGKTRVITRRAAYALASGVIAPSHVLVVTFTERAAAEMKSRLGSLGHPGVAARTFHSAALLQLRHFWPRTSDADFPGIVERKAPMIAAILGRERPPYKFTPARDVAEVIEWAKIRRATPSTLDRELRQGGKTAPMPIDVVLRVWRAYEEAKQLAGRIDFEDMLVRTVELLESDEPARAQVQDRYRWFSVDEYQDTNPLQEALLRLWLGGRSDVAVVGDPDQTIYTFTGASSAYLTDFPRRFPDTRVIELRDNYRSSPEILALANRLATPSVSGEPRLVATHPTGPAPRIERWRTGDLERDALVGRLRALAKAGVEPAETAVLVRTNAQIPELEESLTVAGIGYLVRGERFFAGRDVRDAIAALRALPERERARPREDLADAIVACWSSALGFEPGAQPKGEAAEERQAALETLLRIAEHHLEAADRSIDDFLAELDERATRERDGAASGVTLSTIHRAKGLEWDAVLLPSWEEGLVPHASASGAGELAEERRLAYVAITRARRHLWISWAERRVGRRGGLNARTPSRFLAELSPESVSAAGVAAVQRQGRGPGTARPQPGTTKSQGATASGSMPADSPPPVSSADPALIAALRDWRRRTAAASAVPAYVVMPDVTLTAVAERVPTSLADLYGIKGLGPSRITTYGSALVELCRAHAEPGS